MRKVKIKSAIPVYAVGLMWLIMASANFTFYKLSSILLACALSAGLYALLSLVVPKKKITLKEQPDRPVKSGDAAADAVLNEGRTALVKLADFASAIKNHDVRAQAAVLEGLLYDILDHIAKNPGKASRVRRFVNYYLPTTIKLLENFANLEMQDAMGENVTSTMDSIRSALSNIASAYRSQLDSLFADTRLDISTDIEVLEGMMRSDGLLNDK